ncbi:MAG: trigger factor [Chlamydiales bacterium]|nr:trigger factor [Chlamydiia bacterium]MCP5506995.1 trigger factor [Chlamydiales bacterium]
MSQQEYKNDEIAVKATKNPGCQVEFSITVTPQTVNKFYLQAVKTVKRDISIPGFRKGRAPDEMVIKRFAPSVEREWREQVLSNSVQSAFQLTNLYPYRQEGIRSAKIDSLSKDEGGVVTITFESMPEVPDIDMTVLAVDTIEAEPVKPEEIDQVIEDIRYQHAEWNNVEGRAVEEGDFVDVDVTDIESDKTFLSDTRIEVVKGKIGNWLLNLLVGLNVGESAEGISEQDEGQNNPNFKPTKCRVTIKAIKSSVLPEADDELAKKAGLASLDEMKERIKNDLQKNKEEEARRQTRELLTNTLLQKYVFDIPETLLKQSAQDTLQARAQELIGEQDLENKMQSIEKEVEQEVSAVLRWHFLTRKIAEEQKIGVDQNELIREMIRRHYINPFSGKSNIPEGVDAEMMYSRVYADTLSDKVADYLLDCMKPTGT